MFLAGTSYLLCSGLVKWLTCLACRYMRKGHYQHWLSTGKLQNWGGFKISLRLTSHWNLNNSDVVFINNQRSRRLKQSQNRKKAQSVRYSQSMRKLTAPYLCPYWKPFAKTQESLYSARIHTSLYLNLSINYSYFHLIAKQCCICCNIQLHKYLCTVI